MRRRCPQARFGPFRAACHLAAVPMAYPFRDRRSVCPAAARAGHRPDREAGRAGQVAAVLDRADPGRGRLHRARADGLLRHAGLRGVRRVRDLFRSPTARPVRAGVPPSPPDRRRGPADPGTTVWVADSTGRPTFRIDLASVTAGPAWSTTAAPPHARSSGVRPLRMHWLSARGWRMSRCTAPDLYQRPNASWPRSGPPGLPVLARSCSRGAPESTQTRANSAHRNCKIAREEDAGARGYSAAALDRPTRVPKEPEFTLDWPATASAGAAESP